MYAPQTPHHKYFHVPQTTLEIVAKDSDLSVVTGFGFLDVLFQERGGVFSERLQRIEVQPLFDGVELPGTCLKKKEGLSQS